MQAPGVSRGIAPFGCSAVRLPGGGPDTLRSLRRLLGDVFRGGCLVHSEAPEAATRVEEAVIAKVIVHVGDQN
jgi:hypothetical protein